MNDFGYVLDASALLAAIKREPGGNDVRGLLHASVIGSVNLCEVVATLQDNGLEDLVVDDLLADLGIETIDFDAALATDAGRLRHATRSAGLSLGDRACLALGRQRGAVVLTADRAWATLDIGVTVELIR